MGPPEPPKWGVWGRAGGTSGVAELSVPPGSQGVPPRGPYEVLRPKEERSL